MLLLLSYYLYIYIYIYFKTKESSAGDLVPRAAATKLTVQRLRNSPIIDRLT